MGVDVDDAGRHDHAAGVDGPGGLLAGQAADGGDTTAGHPHVGMTAGEARPVDHETVADDQIEHRCPPQATLGTGLGIPRTANSWPMPVNWATETANSMNSASLKCSRVPAMRAASTRE